MRIARSIALSAAATAAGLVIAAPAMAADTEVPLNNDHNNILASKPEQNCGDKRFEGRKSNEDGWHFIMPSGSFTSITVTFDPDGVKDDDPTDDLKFTGSPTVAGGPFTFYKTGNDWQHAYLFTPAGWLLVSGTSMATGVGENNPKFNVSHACAGTPDEPSSPPSTDPPGNGSPSSSAPGGGGGGGSLPKTGTATSVVVIGGIALVVGGVALLAVRRRRDMIGS